MYTANTMATAIETLGMALPYSSSTPAEDPLKRVECRLAGRYALVGMDGCLVNRRCRCWCRCWCKLATSGAMLCTVW